MASNIREFVWYTKDEWYETGIEFPEAEQWRANGFLDAWEALLWYEAGFSPEDAKKYSEMENKDGEPLSPSEALELHH